MSNNNNDTQSDEIEKFKRQINFTPPEEFIHFFKKINKTEMNINNECLIIWPLADMVRLNKEYQADEYVPEFFIFGSDGGSEAYAIEKTTGCIYQIPFIGMSKEDAILKFKDFSELLDNIK